MGVTFFIPKRLQLFFYLCGIERFLYKLKFPEKQFQYWKNNVPYFWANTAKGISIAVLYGQLVILALRLAFVW